MLDVQNISLAKLIPSPANVRRSGRQEGVTELAASIKAHGLLQNLTVRKGEGDKKGFYEVVAGGRRLAALRRLAKGKHIAANSKVACHVLDGETAEEISLAENVFQCPMHPADQYEAFAKLHAEQNMPAEDIAARFGVSVTVVKQRLKLGSVSPKLIKLYRNGEMTLDQLTAFTITDDRKAQERVWAELPPFNTGRRAILQALTEAQVPGDDRRAIFVGAEDYKAAGGTIVRDLFNGEGEGYFTDPELLNRLVREKLQRSAKRVFSEGWKWVSVEPDFDHGLAGELRRVHARLSPEDQDKLNALLARRSDLYETEEAGEEDVEAELQAVEAEIVAFDDHATYDPADIARAGAFVCLDGKGQVRIERGYVRPEDEAAEATDADAGTPDATQAEDGPKPLSEKLVAELTAARTLALRAALGENPAVALTAVIHVLALRTFYHGGESCLGIAASSASLHHIDPTLAENRDGKYIADQHAMWVKRLPKDAGNLWDALTALGQTPRMALLAYCAAVTVDAVEQRQTPKSRFAHADTLAKALKLDMAEHWQPTAANYFTRVSKERVTEALREAGGADVPLGVFAMKKQAMAEAAATFMAGRRWLPAVLRGN